MGFAIRSGGHSYEGFSQSPDLVIDVRGMRGIKLVRRQEVGVDRLRRVAWIGLQGAGARAIWPFRREAAFPVGVAGHSLGGGFGLLGRPFGLACDSILSMEMVDAAGQIRNVSATENPDLFWALRGGGNGNFGVVTNFNFRTSAVNMVARFGMTWNKPVAQAVKIVQAWQQWLDDCRRRSPARCTSRKRRGGLIKVHLAGLSVQSESKLKAELTRLQKLAGPAVDFCTKSIDVPGRGHRSSTAPGPITNPFSRKQNPTTSPIR